MVVTLEYGQHEDVDGVLAVKVAGDVANAQAAVCCAGIGKAGFLDDGRFNGRTELPMQGGDFGRGSWS